MSKFSASLTSILLISYVLFCGLLSIYSYTQVDLNLTLSSNQAYQRIQTILLDIGYFNRPLSATLYVFILICMFLIYYVLVHQAKQNKLQTSKLIKVSLIGSIILIFAYPAFSYDLFNYIFDARILAHHQQNPYLFTALDFPEDDWTRFMRWTHRTYPYGPTWLPITLVFYLAGMGKFILTLLSFKLLMFGAYWLAAWSIYKLLQKNYPKMTNYGLSLFLFNPLILIEGLVSGHLDMPMMSLMLFSLWLLTQAKIITGTISLLFSVGIKYVSAALIPPVMFWKLGWLSFRRLVEYSLFLSYVLTIIVVSQREILPWYVLVPFGLTALIPTSKWWQRLMLVLTPALLVRYVPFIYWGEYSTQVNLWRHGLMLGVGLGVLFLLYLLDNKQVVANQKP